MFGKEKKPKRFVIREEHSIGLSTVSIIVDMDTGVHYMMTFTAGGGSALTPLLDENGQVVIDKSFKETDDRNPWG